MTNVIEKTLEVKKICASVFLDVSQAFDKVWHTGLKNKLRSLLPQQYAKFLESYLTDRFFRIKFEDTYTDLKSIKAGVPQGSVLGPIQYLVYICDIPQDEVTFTIFADDTATLAVGDNVEEATNFREPLTQFITGQRNRTSN